MCSINLSELLSRALGATAPATDTIVSGISINSRNVQPGHIFVATQAATPYIPDALAQGAVLIVREGQENAPKTVYVDNAALAAAKLCRCFYAHVPETLLAVTGTNGKSSTVRIAAQMLNLLGMRAGSMGTLGVDVEAAKDFAPPSLTTYDPVSLHRILRELSLLGIQCAAIEATSHGLDQYRLDGLRFDAVALTNVTQDHLDYHGSMQKYVDAKMRLFRYLVKDGGTAVLNKSCDPCFFDLCKSTCSRLTTYSCSSTSADIMASHLIHEQDHLMFNLRLGHCTFENISYNGIGAFQVENLLCAIGLVQGAYPNIPAASVIAAIPRLSPIPGRMELVARYNGASIFVDFCHTPDALSKALTALTQLPHKYITVVFGCGGERDPTKRAPMGHIAATLASHVIVTDDNPRFEDAAKIRKDILAGIPQSRTHIAKELPGRKEAIAHALADLSEEDILLIAGRGHESYQTVKGERVPFSDRACVKEILESTNLCRT
jgi:UDP-N-acetylmuramoyl-L-alanyl-D-glutamate--2,6-diaminopimelate ligase